MERLFLRLERPIPGVDHIKVLPSALLLRVHDTVDAVAPILGVDRINDFYVYRGDPPRWHDTSEGLATFRAVLGYFRSGKGGLGPEDRESGIADLSAVESLLQAAHLHRIRFCFVGNY